MIITLLSTLTITIQTATAHPKAKPSERSFFVDWLMNPYLGFGVSPRGNNKNIALGWRLYRLTPVVPAIEFERNYSYFKDNSGHKYDNSMNNINLYLSLYGGKNAVKNMDMKGFNLYTKVGFGKNATGDIHDISAGLGVAWLDIFQIGYQYTTYNGPHISQKSDNAIMFRFNMPIAIPTIGPIYLLGHYIFSNIRS